ncbi:hypothetical protein HBH56_235040 [Parastagonospora nodorum]|uniref:Uncharacterized protein n=1 Tax=Phaeosphaeria nodorum (strain SN15 / ATCC MYA-4574 / FGSC 10173) TaxID=321614 RepID=A0A7U2F8A7_PHANO|nr:hypothetical protein HBH56_235040 [Parastagonospora nodorum]QRC99498.1 hypothetical protein JI435_144070 [Parastagonospora nodorum SN15]KAH3924521.1 hypothetical protein HBH54_193340 [Parastagonospora nodorum]KAH3939222.1 hypothetical protein HBH53_239070 [Parastagonospora nodorum]KAH3959457.1 hypothetical protein HBH52_243430 [Parastagonospora nodorum]
MFSSESRSSRSKEQRRKSDQKPWKGANEIPFASSSPPPAGFRSISTFSVNELESLTGNSDTSAAAFSYSTAYHPLVVKDGEHEEDTLPAPHGQPFLLNLKSFAARNPVFAPGAQPEDEASETDDESDSEFSDQEEVTPVHDTTVEDFAEGEESVEEETDTESPTEGTDLYLTTREWNIRVLTSEFRTKQLEAHHPAQVLINRPPELEFSRLADAKKFLNQVNSLPTDQHPTDIKEAENSVSRAERDLELASARLDTREVQLKLERSSRDVEEMKEYEDHLRAAGTKRQADDLENSIANHGNFRSHDKVSVDSSMTVSQAERENFKAARKLETAILERRFIEAQLAVAKSQRNQQGSGGTKEVFAVEKRLTQAELHIHLLCMGRDKAHRIWQLTQLVERDVANPDIIVHSAFVDHDMVEESVEAASDSSADEPEYAVGQYANQANTHFQAMTDLHGGRPHLHHQHTGFHPFNRPYVDLQEMADQNASRPAAPAPHATQPAPVATLPLPLHGLYDPFTIPLPRPNLNLNPDEDSDDEEVDLGPPVPYNPAMARRIHAHSVWGLSIHALRDARAGRNNGDIEVLQRTMDEARNAYLALGGVVLDPVNGNPYIEPGQNEGNVGEHVAKKQKTG